MHHIRSHDPTPYHKLQQNLVFFSVFGSMGILIFSLMLMWLIQASLTAVLPYSVLAGVTFGIFNVLQVTHRTLVIRTQDPHKAAREIDTCLGPIGYQRTGTQADVHRYDLAPRGKVALELIIVPFFASLRQSLRVFLTIETNTLIVTGPRRALYLLRQRCSVSEG